MRGLSPSVEIGLSPLMPETLAYLQDRYRGPVEYVSQGDEIPFARYDPRTKTIEGASDPSELRIETGLRELPGEFLVVRQKL